MSDSPASCVDGEPVGKALRIANDREGFDALLAHLSSLETPVTVGLEATGHYWLALYSVLTDAEYEVIVLNPLQAPVPRQTGPEDGGHAHGATIDADILTDQVHVMVVFQRQGHGLAQRLSAADFALAGQGRHWAPTSRLLA